LLAAFEAGDAEAARICLRKDIEDDGAEAGAGAGTADLHSLNIGC
jgi:hypothetical protein